MTAPAEVATVVETWLYAGQRLDPKGKIFHAWHDGHDVVHFVKLPAHIPGHAYAVETIRDGDRLSVRGTPRYLAEQGDRQATGRQLDEWRAEHAAAKATVESKRLEKDAGDDELERALEVLRRHHERLRSYVKKGAFQSYVLGEMQRPPAKLKKDEDF